MLDAAFHAGVIMRAREKLMLLNTPAIAVLLHGCWLFCSVLSLFSRKAPCSGKTTTLGVTGGGKDKKEKKSAESRTNLFHQSLTRILFDFQCYCTRISGRVFGSGFNRSGFPLQYSYWMLKS